MSIDAYRRRLIKFLGYGAVSSKFPLAVSKENQTASEVIQPLAPSSDDELILVDGLSFDIVVKWRDPINAREKFGSNNDFIAFLSEDKDTGILWINHESFRPVLVSGTARNKKNIDTERKEVGGSLLKVKRMSSRWKLIANDKMNKRIDATTEIPFTINTEIKGKSASEGTLANCAGGTTPWGTFLSCEENYHSFYGDYDLKTKKPIKS